MKKIDLKDAYFSVKIDIKHRKYLRFRWKGKSYQYRALPFGLATAPRVFTKVMREAVSHLREKGIRLVHYLDDILILGETLSICQTSVLDTAAWLKKLGFVLNMKKCIFFPQIEIEFLRFLINSQTLKISLPKSKVHKIAKESRSLARKSHVSARELAQLIGKMTAVIPAVIEAPLHYRALQRLRLKILHLNKFSYNGRGSVNQESLSDLEWWTQNLVSRNGRSLLTPVPAVTMETDASKRGWGACCQGVKTGGPWRKAETLLHINFLELKAAFLAIRTFLKDQTNIHALVKMDNRTSIAYINRKGGTHSKKLSDLACQLWSWCLNRGITIQAEHIAGIDNVTADWESRVFLDPADWKLCRRVFSRSGENRT